MLYGGQKFQYFDDIPSDCSSLEKKSNCTVIEVTNMKTYNDVMFLLWEATMGREFDREVNFFKEKK